ncbi:MAG: Cu(I)-responsive transcriptional regulator [Betaproteobacteria bacterium]
MRATTKFAELGEAKGEGLTNIGHAARRSGVSAKMIRHYEDIGLVHRVGRTRAGYRIYRDTDIHTLQFIRRSRDLGFTIKEIGLLLGLWQNRRRASADVKKLALKHIADLDARIAEMQAMRMALTRLVDCCHGDQRPDCPILDDLGA